MSLLMKAKSFPYLPVLLGHQAPNLKAAQTSFASLVPNRCFRCHVPVANCVNQIAVDRE